MKYQLWFLLLSLLLFLPIDVESAEDSIVITISPDGEAKITQNLNPRSTVSGISVPAISDKISKILATDGNGIILQTIQKGNSISIATLGATQVNLSYEAEIISKNLNIWNLSYNADREITVVLPPLSSIVSVNNIPIDIDDKAVTMPPGHISLSYTIRQVSSQNFDASKEGKNYQIQIITGSKISDFEYRNNEIHFDVDEKAPILVIVPKLLVPNPLDVSLNDNQVEFKPYYQNSTSSWLRIDPYQSGNIKIGKVSTTEFQGGGCLIATATFGSEFAPQVQQLREVRDNAVLKTESGAAFMAGFNQFYYSFSPTIADWERENPVFKQFVKLAISPLLTTLSILNYFEIDSEEEMLGFGIAIILLNIAIYFLVPFVTIVTISNYIKSRSHRTCCSNQSNHLFKSIKYHKKSVKSRLVVALALMFILVSVPSAFAQVDPDPDPEPDPLQIVLDQSKDQLDPLIDPASSPSSVLRLYELGIVEYDAALASLVDDPDAAKDHAIVAMALFEDALSILSSEYENQVLDQIGRAHV
ncbi:MAG: CFI-box-CTERM domain-containing protein [Nitrosopumilaceae archaeon]